MATTKYSILNEKERDMAILQILDTLLDSSLPFSGEHRREQWEKGWGENLKENNLKPKYFGKYKVNRLNGKFVWGMSENYEQDMLYTIVDQMARTYLTEVTSICEFGCGTGHNLLRIREHNPDAILIGLDWATSSNKLVETHGIEGVNFDYFNPPQWDMPDDVGVITVASLEQTGTNFIKFVDYLLEQKPKIVVNIEPIPELLDPKNLLDYLSIKYMEKRKYLSGYLIHLRKLEKEGKIKILEARRSSIGSMFIDGYSIIVWKPI